MERKVAIITGASRGIGAQIAYDLAASGYDVVINYQSSKAKAQEVQKQCERFGVKALIYQADVGDWESVQAMFTEVMTAFGRIDLLVNNSGITRDQLVLRMTPEDFDKVIDVNLKGTFYCTKAVSKYMFKQRSGVIINLASVVGLSGNIGQANYAASKAGIIGLTKTVAKELAGRNIRVNAIAPGFIETEMTAVLDEKTKAQIIENIPLRTFGQASDVSQLVVFLASDKAQYITGQTIQVDGGMVI